MSREYKQNLDFFPTIPNFKYPSASFASSHGAHARPYVPLRKHNTLAFHKSRMRVFAHRAGKPTDRKSVV